MKTKAFIFRLVVVILMFIVAAILYPRLPENIPIHWGMEGQPDEWGAKMWAIWIIPGISLILLFLFPLLAKIDPRRKNYDAFSGTYEIIQNLIILFLTFVFFMQFFMTLRPENQDLMPTMMLAALGIMFVILGNYMGKVRQNYFLGLRTPWTLNDPEVWQKSQRVMGWAFVVGGFIFLLQAWLQLYVITSFIVVMSVIVVVPMVYSYLIYKKKH